MTKGRSISTSFIAMHRRYHGLKDPDLRFRTSQLLRQLLPHIRSLLEGEEVSITYETTEDIELLLDQFEVQAGPELSDAIEMIREKLSSWLIAQSHVGWVKSTNR